MSEVWHPKEEDKRETNPNDGEKIPLSEEDIETHLSEIDKVLSKLIETGPELSDDVIQGLKGRLQANLSALGLNSMEEYLDYVVASQQKFNESFTNLPVPDGYPDKETFEKSLMSLYGKRDKEHLLPDVPQKPSVVQVAEFSQGDWNKIEGRGRKNTVDYLYDLGKVLCNKSVYTSIFDDTDAIQVGKRWEITNGRHRALSLRVLGPSYVKEKGLDKWVMVCKEN